MWVFVVLVVAGCGRIGFDPSGDALGDSASRHDEDGDGLLDVDDPCPHLPGTNADADGDRVGDACDPLPTTPTERIARFATMMPGDQPFALTGAGTWTPEADAVHCTGTVCLLRVDRMLGDVRVHVGAEITERLGAAGDQHQLALRIGNSGPTFYATEVNEVGSYTVASITYFDGDAFVSQQQQDLAAGVHPGDLDLRHDARRAPSTVAFDGGWPGERYRLELPGATYTGGTYIRVNTNNLGFRVRYAIVIETL